MRIRHIAVGPAARGARPSGPAGAAPPGPAGWPGRAAPGRSRRRTDPRRSASASGSSRGGGRRPGADDRLHRAVAAGDHQVEAVEVELLDRGREERQVVAVPARRPRQVLDERGVQRPGARCAADTAPGTCSSVKICASGQSAQSASSTFSPPRMPVSQSWTSATRQPAVGGRGPAASGAVAHRHPASTTLVVDARGPAARPSAQENDRARATPAPLQVGAQVADRRGRGPGPRRWRASRSDRPGPRRRRPPRAATRCSRSRPACRRPSPRAAAGRSLRRATGRRTPRPGGRGRPASGPARSRGSARSWCRLWVWMARRSSAYFEMSLPMISSFSAS